jgi:hypothetical protein
MKQKEEPEIVDDVEEAYSNDDDQVMEEIPLTQSHEMLEKTPKVIGEKRKSITHGELMSQIISAKSSCASLEKLE